MIGLLQKISRINIGSTHLKGLHGSICIIAQRQQVLKRQAFLTLHNQCAQIIYIRSMQATQVLITSSKFQRAAQLKYRNETILYDDTK